MRAIARVPVEDLGSRIRASGSRPDRRVDRGQVGTRPPGAGHRRCAIRPPRRRQAGLRVGAGGYGEVDQAPLCDEHNGEDHGGGEGHEGDRAHDQVRVGQRVRDACISLGPKVTGARTSRRTRLALVSLRGDACPGEILRCVRLPIEHRPYSLMRIGLGALDRCAARSVTSCCARSKSPATTAASTSACCRTNCNGASRLHRPPR